MNASAISFFDFVTAHYVCTLYDTVMLCDLLHCRWRRIFLFSRYFRLVFIVVVRYQKKEQKKRRKQLVDIRNFYLAKFISSSHSTTSNERTNDAPNRIYFKWITSARSRLSSLSLSLFNILAFTTFRLNIVPSRFFFSIQMIDAIDRTSSSSPSLNKYNALISLLSPRSINRKTLFMNREIEAEAGRGNDIERIMINSDPSSFAIEMWRDMESDKSQSK